MGCAGSKNDRDGAEVPTPPCKDDKHTGEGSSAEVQPLGPTNSDVLSTPNAVDGEGKGGAEGAPRGEADEWHPPGVPMDAVASTALVITPDGQVNVPLALPPAPAAPADESPAWAAPGPTSARDTLAAAPPRPPQEAEPGPGGGSSASNASAVRDIYDQIFGGEATTPEAQQVQGRAVEVYTAYYGFFDHIGLRKGWRTAPFDKEEVQVPFWTAAQAVALVRAELDRSRGEGIVLRQVVGTAMDFLWSWNPDRRLEPAGGSSGVIREFVSGLVFATLSDGRGLVEGLESGTVEVYVDCHPFWQQAADWVA